MDIWNFFPEFVQVIPVGFPQLNKWKVVQPLDSIMEQRQIFEILDPDVGLVVLNVVLCKLDSSDGELLPAAAKVGSGHRICL